MIGLGKMGLLHTCLLNVMPEVKIVALCEKSSLMRRIAGKALKGVTLVDDVEKLAGFDLDFVYITTPIPSHFFIAKTVYSRNISCNLFVEKTLGASFDQAKDMCKLAENCGGKNMVGYMKRYAVTFRKAKSLLDEGVLGRIDSFNAYAYSSDFADAGSGSKTTNSRGGVLADLGSHVVDIALWFFGEFHVESVATELASDHFSEDHVSFKIKRLDGLEGVFDVSWRTKGYRMPESGIKISGSEGNLTVNDDEVDLESRKRSRKWYRHDLNDNVDFLIGGPEYFREDKRYVQSIADEYDAEPSFQTAMKVDRLLEEVRNRS